MLTPRQLFLRHLAQTNDIPLALEIVRAEGCHMYDAQGRAYLDLIAGISVSALGHGHPRIKDAVCAQIERYSHLMVYGEYVQAPQVEYAYLLASLLPDPLDTVYFTNSGTEATEGAMKLAKRATGRTEIVSFRNSYHGSTQGALSLGGDERQRNAFRPLLPDMRRLHYGRFEDLEQITERSAAVFVEPIQSEAGAHLPPAGFLKALRDRCSQVGALLVFDEIQTGLGRTGPLWQSGHDGIVPDVVLLGKALGGGMPLGAFVASQDLMRLLSFDPVLGHITTFGGHPVSCAAGMAALQVLLEENLPAQVAGKESLFRERLQHPAFRALHGQGLLLALELDGFAQVQALIRHAISRGLVTDWFLYNDRCIRIAPPLVISEAEINEACDILLEGAEGI